MSSITCSNRCKLSHHLTPTINLTALERTSSYIIKSSRTGTDRCTLRIHQNHMCCCIMSKGLCASSRDNSLVSDKDICWWEQSLTLFVVLPKVSPKCLRRCCFDMFVLISASNFWEIQCVNCFRFLLWNYSTTANMRSYTQICSVK